MARGTGFSVKDHAEFGQRIKQIMADISSLTDSVLDAYPSPNNSFRNHVVRQFDRARAKLQIARDTAENRMYREHPHDYDKNAYRG